MELQLSSFPILCTLLVLIFVFTVLKTVERSKTSTGRSPSNLPPGPRKLPLIGNLHQFVGSLPHHALRDMARKHGPVMSLQLGEVSTIVVSSAEAAKEVLKTHDINFATRPAVIASTIMSYDSTNIAFAPYGEYWRQLRKICAVELLSAKRVLSFRPIREEEVSELIRSIINSNVGGGSRPINLTERIHASAYTTTSRAAFGKKFEDQEAFISIVKEALKLASGFEIADLYPSAEWLHSIMSGTKTKLEKLHKQADRIMEQAINEHKVCKAAKITTGEADEEDLIYALLEYHHENATNEFSLTVENIKAVILDIFAAGSETSASTVDWAMTEMMKAPRIMKKAQAEVREVYNGKETVDETGIHKLEYLKLIIKETLRLHPANPLLLPRVCGERCQINGYEIPAKTKVIVNGWAICRDPSYWADAECFIPERFLDSSMDYKGNHFEYIPFGAGRRICPGMTFGLANVEFPLAKLLYHFDWELPIDMNQEDLDMTEAFGLTVRRKEDLYLIPVPYEPVPV